MANASWSCIDCGATDNFVSTTDRMLHVTRGHVGRVVSTTQHGNDIEIQHVQFDPKTKRWS